MVPWLVSSGGCCGAHGLADVRKEIHDRFLEIGNEEAVGDPCFRQLLDQHFERLPASYSIVYLLVEKAEDVLLHRRILAECADHERRPVFHARFLGCIQQDTGSSPTENGNGGGSLASNLRNGELGEVEPGKKMMEDLSLERRKGFEAISARRDSEIVLLHEIIFSSIDKPKLLSQLSALLSELGLNIREAHVYFTKDGFCLDVFVVDGWHTEETDGLLQRLKETAKAHHASLSSSASERILELQEKIGDSEFGRSFVRTRTRHRVPPASSAIRKTTSPKESRRERNTQDTPARSFEDPKPCTPGRDPIRECGGYGLP